MTAATDAVEPEAGFLARQDVTSLGVTLAKLPAGVARHPAEAWRAGARYLNALSAGMAGAAARVVGAQPPAELRPAARDRRFADPAWDRNPFYFASGQAYLAWARCMRELTSAGVTGGTAAEQEKTAFAVGLMVDALAPTNFLLSNPAALRKALKTRGGSVLKGQLNFLRDVVSNGGMPSQVDRSGFEVGRNMACTPGKVVFRNDLMELIQYEPQTKTVFSVPLLLSPPWINKYYIMDLAPKRSFVEWAVQHGHTVFAISYRNPDESMRNVALDDYLIQGPREAIDVVRDITGAPQVNLVGLCLGGSLTVMLLAYLADTCDDRVRSASLLNTLVDFSQPGPLGVFTDATTIERLERKMAKRGFLEESDMANTFNALRNNELIWNYVASNWLMGEKPPAFDILAWNGDSTRMPAAMHSFYLRSCYLKNELAEDKMVLAGVKLHLGDIPAETYIVAAVEDHIAPWRSSYATTKLLRGPARFVLTSSGHIAGIVNPPGPKARHWVNDDVSGDADTWRGGATEHAGSWWEDWAVWIKTRAGKRVRSPSMGNATYPVLGDAPGTYVHG
ncbi:MAG: alpha/beta fold hydrolase [Actinomycetota bacterium]|nr:alpha/beta fold hydrolase [Actinomycetota bacterium]MDQ6948118.1 alpha/beta fold hydrolase [Actinomycetota bacterium]